MHRDTQHLIGAGCRAAQAWLDDHNMPRFELDGQDAWLQVLVEADLLTQVRPCAFRPDEDDVVEDGPATGPAGEPGIGMRLWRPLAHTILPGGTKVAVYVAKPVYDDAGEPRKLWMPM